MFRGCTFDNQNVNSKNDGGLYQAIFRGDGILWGCSMSVTNDTLTVQQGEMMIAGRLVWVDGATQISFSDPIANGYGQVILTIDLSKTATTSEFKQVEPTVVYSTTTTFPELTQGDINGVGGDMIYQQELAVVSIAGSSITGITRQIGEAEIGAAKLGGKPPEYYMPKIGGTMTGDINMGANAINFSASGQGTASIKKAEDSWGTLVADGHLRVLGQIAAHRSYGYNEYATLIDFLNTNAASDDKETLGIEAYQDSLRVNVYRQWVAAGTLNTAIYIAQVTGQVGLPGSAATTTANAANAFFGASNGLLYKSTSSIRIKKAVSNITGAVASIEKLRPVTFKSTAEADDPDKIFMGFIAEEVAAAIPDAAIYATEETYTGRERVTAVDAAGEKTEEERAVTKVRKLEAPRVEHYDHQQILALAVAAIQEQQKEIEGLKGKADRLTALLVEKGILTEEEVEAL